MTQIALQHGKRHSEPMTRKSLWEIVHEGASNLHRTAQMCDPPADVFWTHCEMPPICVRFLQSLHPGLAQSVECAYSATAHIGARTQNDAIDHLRREMLSLGVLSETVTNRANLQALLGEQDEEIRLPSKEALQKLTDSVIFSDADLGEILAPVGCAISDLSHATLTQHGSKEEYKIGSGLPFRYPLARLNGYTVVAFPHLLAATAYQRAHDRLEELRLSREFQLRYHQITSSRAVFFLAALAGPTLAPTIFDIGEVHITECICRPDQNTPIVAFIITETFSKGHEWPSHAIASFIDVRVRRLIKEEGPDWLPILIIFATSLSDLSLDLPDVDTVDYFSLSTNELEVTALSLDSISPLYLYRYLRRLATWRTAVNLHSPSFLCSLAAYQDAGESFPDPPKDIQDVIFTPSFESIIRGRVHERRNPIVAQSPTEARTYVVLASHNAKEDPLYLTPQKPGYRYIFVKESIGVWLTSTSRIPAYTDAVSYWLIALVDVLQADFEAISQREGRPLLVTIADSASESTSPAPISAKIIDENQIVLEFDEVALGPIAIDSNNVADRFLLDVLLNAIGSMSGRAGESSWVARVIDRVAPLGTKRMLHLFPVVGEFTPEGLPDTPPLLIESIDTDEQLDAFASHILQSRSPGSVAPSDVKAILSDAVTFFFERLQGIASEWNRDALLQFAIRNDEALVKYEFRERQTLAAQASCYGHRDGSVDSLIARRGRFWATSVASRFLIEFLSSLTPNSGRSPGLRSYVDALSCCYHINSYGIRSDFCQYRLVDLDVEILPSGRLSINQTDVFERYRSDVVSEEIWSSQYGLMTELPADKGTDVDSLLTGLDHPFEAEFGYSLRDFRDAVGICLKLFSAEHDDAFLALPREQLQRMIVQSLEWSTTRIEAFWASVTLSARDDFLRPGADFSPADVYPWKFNRRLSYLRRPFIERSDGRVLVGPRNLARSLRYITDLLLGGRIWCKTPEMRRAMGQANDRNGDEFSRSVYSIAMGLSLGPARHGAKRFGPSRIQDDRGDLGDIDVLLLCVDRRIVYVMECKDFEICKTARDVSDALRKLTEAKPGKRSKLDLHILRCQWVRNNLPIVLEDFQQGDHESWIVVPLLVVSEPMIDIVGERCGMRVVTPRKLEALLLEDDSTHG